MNIVYAGDIVSFSIGDYEIPIQAGTSCEIIPSMGEYTLENKNYCKLILLDNDELVGFISIFEHDCDERKNLSPWYATMFVKKEYRGKGYSKILNDAILKEAKARGFKKLYLKTTLNNYYEKFGFMNLGLSQSTLANETWYDMVLYFE